MILKKFFQKGWIFIIMLPLLQAAVVFQPLLSGGPDALAQTPSVGTSAHSSGNLIQGLTRIAPPGWHLVEPAKRFGPKDVWEHIDGQAEFFLAYDMVQMIFCQYTDPSKADAYVDVSIYDMGNPANAFGVFAAERKEDAVPMDLGREGYRMGAHLFLWKGPYYVCMIASQDSTELEGVNLQLAGKLLPLLHDPGEPLWGLQTLPRVDRVKGSEQYFRKDALGLEFMKDTYTAQYRKRGSRFTAFLMQKEHPAAAAEVVRRYGAYATQLGEGVREVARHGVAILLCDMDGSFDALFQKEDMVAGVTSIEDAAIAVDLAYELWQGLPGRARDTQKGP